MSDLRTAPDDASTPTPARTDAEPAEGLAQPTLYICGINHERADLSARERFAMNAERCLEVLGLMRKERLASEGLILSTCNRTELYTFGSPEEAHADRLEAFFLAMDRERDRASHVPPIYTYVGQEAVRHLFAVNAGLDSMILGENEIKAQMQQAYAMSKRQGLTGANLHLLIKRANFASKRIRTETGLNKGTLCYGRAAVLKAEEVLGTIEGKVCIVIGAGKVGRTAAQALAERRPARLFIINRTPENAREIAEGIDAEVVSIPEMAPVIRDADLIIGAAFAPNFVVTRQMFEQVRGPEARKRNMCLIDAAVPRILDHAIGELDGVTRLDIGDLESIITTNREMRRSAGRRAWKVVEEEVEKFHGQVKAASLGPMIDRLRRSFDMVFDGLEGDLDIELPDPSRSSLTKYHHRLKQRLLHEAIRELKKLHLGR